MKISTQPLLLFLAISTTIAITSVSLASTAVGFKNGNSLEAIEISGVVTAFCQNQNGIGSNIQTYSCHAEILNPSEADYFVGPMMAADQVVLTSTQASGKVRTKSSEYDSSKGQSTSRFNLWLASLTQKPLLNVGENKIHYVLQKSGANVSQGDFVATVHQGASVRCQDSTINPPFASDCSNEFMLCDRYFQENNYCQ